MKKLAYLLFISICLTSCKQCKRLNGHTELSGRVLDGVSGKSVPYARVALGTLESTWGGVIGQTIERMTTDSKGNYSFKFTADKNKNYYLIAKANSYFESDIEAHPVNEGYRTTNYNIGLPPQATIKIHVKKTDMSYDYLSLSTYTDESGSTRGAFGYNVDSNIYYTYQKGGIYKHIYVYIEKYISGIRIEQKYDTLKNIYFIPIDTTYINLNY